MGPPGGPIFGTVFRFIFCRFFVSRLQKRNVLVSMKLCGLWRPEGQLGRLFWAKPVLRSFSGPRIGSVGASCFVDDLVSCWGKRGAYRLLLEPSWRMLKVAFYNFVVWWLDCLLLKEGASALCSLRWLLEVILAVAEFVGFRAGGRLPFESLYWILYCPLLAPLAPLDSYRSFQPRKNMNYHVFSQSRY